MQRSQPPQWLWAPERYLDRLLSLKKCQLHVRSFGGHVDEDRKQNGYGFFRIVLQSISTQLTSSPHRLRRPRLRLGRGALEIEALQVLQRRQVSNILLHPSAILERLRRVPSPLARPKPRHTSRLLLHPRKRRASTNLRPRLDRPRAIMDILQLRLRTVGILDYGQHRWEASETHGHK